MNLNTQVGAFGQADQAVEPPDTQVAAGPANLVEAVNDTLSVWSKTTGALISDADLNTFFSVGSQFFTDPRVLYDAVTGHFFLSGWSLDASNNTKTYLAVSNTTDPTAGWTIYTVKSSVGVITDQPMIGVCDDKVVMAWNQFTASGTTFAYDGASALVLQKSTLTSLGLPPVAGELFTTPNEFRLVPAQSLTATTTCYMAVNNASADLPGSTNTPMLGVVAITGTPALSDVALHETDMAIATTNAPPSPQQIGGAVEPASNNDDRLLSAVWQNNQLWTSGNDACTPGGDTTARNCMRLDEVNTSTMSVSQDFDLGTPGLDEYYPAVSVDSSGDLSVAYSASSSAQDPGAFAVISPAGTDSFTAPITIEAGAGSYKGVSGSNRWGDYSAAAPDPSTAGAMWVAGEWAPSDASTGDWGTGAAEVSLPAGFPAITSAAQASFTEGTGGTFQVVTAGSPTPTLTETGTLPAGASFDTTTGILSLSSSPATGIGGSYPIQITATNTAGSVNQAFTLKVKPAGPVYTPVSPVRVLDTRNGTGHSGALGANASFSLQVTGSNGVPSGATAVVLNVTATGPTASSFVTVWPDLTTRPTASNLNFTAGETIPNLVVVPVGSNGKVDFYNHTGSVNLVADLAGYYSTGGGSSFVPAGPLRVLDTRNGTGGFTTPVGANSTIFLPVTGTDGVPSDATAVVLNVTATGPTASSFVTVYPEQPTRPTASNLNFTAGETIANQVVVPVVFGSVAFYNHAGSVNLVADLAGYFTTGGGSSFTSVSPVRVLDTRNGTGHSGALGQNAQFSLTLTGAAATAKAVVLNVTATGPTASSFVTVWPDGETRPTASSLNFSAGETIPNLVVVPVIDGKIDFYNHTGSVNLVADLAGYYTN